MRIRDALPGDVQAMVDVALEAFWREYGSRKEAERAFKGRVARRWESLIERGAGIVLVAEEGDQVVGFLVFRWWFGWNGWLEAIAIRKEYRGRGIGTRLTEALIERAREMGYKKICLAVKQQEVARFYEKFGARHFGELPEGSGALSLYYVPVG